MIASFTFAPPLTNNLTTSKRTSLLLRDIFTYNNGGVMTPMISYDFYPLELIFVSVPGWLTSALLLRSDSIVCSIPSIMA